MQAFLFVLGLMIIVIAFGVFLSLRLNKGRIVGKRRRVRARSVQTLAAESTAEDDGLDEVYESLNPTVSTSTSLARGILVILFAGFAIVVVLLAGLLSTLLR